MAASDHGVVVTGQQIAHAIVNRHVVAGSFVAETQALVSTRSRLEAV